ncbi:hypothetical protein ALC62_03433 [Cyphomyrmex costatus]|uniref:Uncharacterized protein n=1 Tax=Cyphomyrmex costatus TaxID=456900 RepID=A0A195CYA1_9HYME|nr:hypothetical protein ALC62_03433 [Cyphomyrmex costatus]
MQFSRVVDAGARFSHNLKLRRQDTPTRLVCARRGWWRQGTNETNRWEAGEALMTLAGPGPRWRNGREVEVRGRRRAQTAISTDAPDLPHAAL